jgi:hypothetical protein
LFHLLVFVFESERHFVACVFSTNGKLSLCESLLGKNVPGDCAFLQEGQLGLKRFEQRKWFW